MSIYCPKCTHVELNTTVRQDVEIDYCPECNGIWLDNGELKKIISHYVDKDFLTELNTRVISNYPDKKCGKVSEFAAEAVIELIGLSLE